MTLALIPRKQDVEPLGDYGFFGPGSPAWRVWGHPTALTVGFQRSVVVEELDPALVAAVDQSNQVRERPRTRYDRTIRYFALVAIGDSESAIKASNVLVKVHAKGVGIEPLSGRPFDANDPHSQLWIHLTGWHSVLYAYEKYGPGRLSPADEALYWEQCAIAAELQTCDSADVPRSREGIRAYFEQMRPKLAGSEAAQAMMEHLLNAEVMLPASLRRLGPVTWVINKTLRVATIATMPRWMRRLGGLRQSRVLDALVIPLMKLNYRVAGLSKRGQVVLLRLLSPSTVSVAAPMLLGVPPRREETLTPAQARERHGVLPPAEEYERFRAHIVERAAARNGDAVEEPDGSEAILGER